MTPIGPGFAWKPAMIPEFFSETHGFLDVSKSHAGLLMQKIGTRPGKRLQFANLKMAIEIVSWPIRNGDFP